MTSSVTLRELDSLASSGSGGIGPDITQGQLRGTGCLGLRQDFILRTGVHYQPGQGHDILPALALIEARLHLVPA